MQAQGLQNPRLLCRIDMLQLAQLEGNVMKISFDTALITGSSRGLGRAIAARLLSDPWSTSWECKCIYGRRAPKNPPNTKLPRGDDLFKPGKSKLV